MGNAPVAADPETMSPGDWMKAIDAARTDEEAWRKDAEKAQATFRGEANGEAKTFNLYHANVQVMVPAAFNSTPIPDVRRRFSDKDPVGKAAADILERALSYSLDVYGFDNHMKLAAYDMAIAGRGVVRVAYNPTVKMDQDLGVEKIAGQDVEAEFVPWQHFIRGPSITWETMPWCAFEHFLDRRSVRQLAPDMVDKIPFTHSALGEEADKKRKSSAETPAAFKRARILEVWDAQSRRVLFVCPDYTDAFVREAEDPLGLDAFFPVPRPVQFIPPVGSLVPVCPLTIYRGLLNELNEVTRRITKLVKQLRPRGGYAASGENMKSIMEADDGELVPLEGLEAFMGQGGIEKAIVWFPMEPTVLALKELLAQRDVVKQTIYELTGIADIMRGASNPGDTATAQRIKSQYGSVRLRDMQGELARLARDVLRMKAEIMSRFFQPDILMEMTGIKLPTAAEKQIAMAKARQNPEQAQQIAQANPEIVQILQGPTSDEVFGLLRSAKMRSYRIDIETDSTIRGDQSRDQEQMAAFLSGTAQFMSAIGPAVKEGQIPGDVAAEIYAAFCRKFQLGKSAEDALERLVKSSQQQAAQKQDPAAGEQAKAQADATAKAEIEKMRLAYQQQADAVKADGQAREMELKRQLEEMKAQVKVYEIDSKDARERDAHAQEMQTRQRTEAMKQFGLMQQRSASAQTQVM